MSWIAWIAVAYGATMIALWLAFMDKPFWFNYKGDRKLVHTPLFKLFIVMFLATFVFVSLVPHILCRFVGLRGFWDWREKSYTMQNPFKRGGQR